MPIETLDATVLIGGVDVTVYLDSLERTATLEKPPASVTMKFSKDLAWASLNPWDDLEIWEQGVKTFTGFVSHIIPRRNPLPETEIIGQDTYKRALDWFVSDEYITSGSSGLTVGYYTGLFCNLCGLSYTILDSVGAAIPINIDMPLGLRPVSEILIQMCQIGQWQMWVDANGVLNFDHLNYATTPDYTLDTVESFEEELNDTDTRNSVKIWGMWEERQNGAGQILYQEQRLVTGVPDTRAMLFSAPAIDTLAKAISIAKAALDQWAKLEHLERVTLIGNPNIRVGQSFQHSHARLIGGSYLNTVTDLRATLNSSGYNQDLTAGRRSYRYPYWTSGSTPTNYFYNGSTMVGLFRAGSTPQVWATLNWNDGSPTWYNVGGGTGITGFPRGIATDKVDGKKIYAITDTGLWMWDDVSITGTGWHHLLTFDQITAIILAVPSYALIFTASYYGAIGGLTVHARSEGVISFQFTLTPVVIGAPSAYTGVFVIATANAGENWNAIDGRYWNVLLDPSFPFTGSNTYSSRFGELTFSYNHAEISGNGTLVMVGHDEPAELNMIIANSGGGYHSRGENARCVWGGGATYIAPGAITISTPSPVTPFTGLVDPSGFPKGCAMSADDGYALGMGISGHLWSWSWIAPTLADPTPVNNFWVDLGLISTDARSVLAMPDNPRHFAIGEDAIFLDSTDGGITWISKGGPGSSLFFVDMDY